ncbi:hypothetical protein EXS71_00730 [Candidatus Uhrbacteria bacterium]|nr:hypothetical protein [Candidatus Uhrbacteria bacterium]
MTKFNKVLLPIVGVIVIAFVIVKLNQSPAAPTIKPTITIGYIAPLSGNVAFLGEGVKNAAELALADLQTKNTKYNYKLLFEDNDFSPAKTASAAQKLISVDHVDALVTVASSAGRVVTPIAEKAQVIHVGIASDPNIAKGTYNFINWTPPDEEVPVFVNQMKKRNIKKLAVFGQQISGITAVIDELKKEIAGTDMQIVSEDISNAGDKDFRTAIKKAEAANPDYFLMVMFSPELEIVAKQIKELGIKIPITAIESFELSDKPELFEGLWYVNAADPTPAFANAYQTKYGKNPSIATPNSYDILGMIVAAAETFDGKTKPSTTDLANALARVRGYNGALGNNISMNANHVVISKAVVRIIKDGKPATINP